MKPGNLQSVRCQIQRYDREMRRKTPGDTIGRFCMAKRPRTGGDPGFHCTNSGVFPHRIGNTAQSGDKIVKNITICRKLVSAALAAALVAGACPAAYAADGYTDFDYITSHVNLAVPGELRLTRPSEDITTSASAYFITGGSDPDSPLTMNGEPVQTRGARGSFGVYVALGSGGNVFTFKNGGKTATVTITRGGTAQVATISNVRDMTPGYDAATFSGKTITLSCTAPSGASVTATVGGRKVPLKQAAATAYEGVPATFTAKTTAGEVDGTRNLGPVTYTLTYKGKTTSYQSAGSVYLTGSGSRLLVQVKNAATSLYQDDSWSAFIECPKQGGVDAVAEIGQRSYRLASGGWIPKESVQPLTEAVPVALDVREVGMSVYDSETGGDYGETFELRGDAKPMFRAWQDGEKLYVKLMNTTLDTGWAESLDEAVAQSSRLFSGVRVSADGGATVLEFLLTGQRALWGYDVSYGEEGGVAIYAKYAPRLSGGSQPLKNVVIAVDAGHGGADPGAIGIPGTGGAMEKDITLATAVAVQKRLESLGATVVLCRGDDSDLSMNDRMRMTRARDADLFISLHCNSVGYNQDANRPSGTEVYYYEPIAKGFAATMSSYVSGYTDRTNRGAKHSNYRVTLNSFAPSVLVEMGFLTNPAEYDSMASRAGIFQTANAVGDGVLAFLS